MTSVDEVPSPELQISSQGGAGRTEGGAVPPASQVDSDAVVAELTDDDYRSLTLRHPITLNGERLMRIRMRPPFLEDIDDWSNAEISNRDLLARLCGLPPAVLKKLVWNDAEALMEIFHQLVPEFMFAAAKDDA
ncbi:phage tail assembly protein [Mesorhizobium sp.]|uniref:phage tail assembly protein n=1 Tax=Mesorhizobium sp. TaxID=1871066 RepID=UPI0025C2D9BA|nr:phage tail assembly protein [Mesorhizobium sp.]